MKAFLTSTGKELAARISVAESLSARIRGLLGRDSLPVGEGLLIRPCKGIHTFFMKFPIDVMILDKGNRILKSYSRLSPNRITTVYLKAATVLELPAGTLDQSLSVGDSVDFI
jgi:uncharacterized protein